MLSRFTAFVAVDRSEVVNAGGQQHRVIQPVEIPAGWDVEAEMQAAAFCLAPISHARSALGDSGRGRMRKSKPEITKGGARSGPESMPADACFDFDCDDSPPPPPRLSEEMFALDDSSQSDRLAKNLSDGVLGRKQESLDWRTLRNILEELQDEVERVKQHGDGASREEFAELVASFETLATVLAQAQHASSDALRQLADDGRRLVATWTTAGDDAAVKAQLATYLEAATQQLSNLRAAAKRRRGAFWKAT